MGTLLPSVQEKVKAVREKSGNPLQLHRPHTDIGCETASTVNDIRLGLTLAIQQIY